MKKFAILLIVLAIVLFLNRSNEQEVPPSPTPDIDVRNFDAWFAEHHPKCDICLPTWPPLMCDEAWSKFQQEQNQMRQKNE
jgi:hypothetical protein